MKKYFFLALLLGIVCSCNELRKPKSTLLNPSNLLLQSFQINIDKDTTLSTLNGSIIRIPKGSLSTSGNSIVTIEIKEAYTIEQMLQAGLYTQSNGQPLSSGGMIYINARGSETVKITQAISVSIPTPFVEKNMQLYKGDLDSDSNINWVNPQPMSDNEYTQALDRGASLYKSFACNGCHAIGRDLTGPDLAHVVKRSPKYASLDTINTHNLLYDFTRNSTQVIGNGHPYYSYLFCKYNRAPMNIYPSISDSSLKLIYDWIENESERQNLPVPNPGLLGCIDSCQLYMKVVEELWNRKKELSQDSIPMVIERITNEFTRRTVSQSQPSSPFPANSPIWVDPSRPTTLYYQFTVEAFGWYNVDILIKQQEGSVESELMVRVMGQYRKKLTLYLIIPSAKILGPGGLLKDEKDVYGFFTEDGKIPLPQSVPAYVLGIAEEEEHIAYGFSRFTTKTKNDIQIQLNASTYEEFNREMKTWNLDSLSIQAEKTKNADTLINVNKQLNDAKTLKPKKCDCSCLGESGAR